MLCDDNIPLENLDYCSNDEVAPGVSEVEVYFASISDFQEIASVPKMSEGTDLESLGTIAEAHTFKEGLGFHKVYIKPDTGLVDGAQAGEKGGLSIVNNFGGVLPSTGARTGGWIRKYLNRPVIALVTERTGLVKQIGSKLSPAYMTEVTPTGGQKSGDSVGVTIKISDSTGSIAPVYVGTIEQFTPPVAP
jgi:hypothetical protein